MSTQHTKPCSECPFRRTVKPGALGGSPVETYVGQAYGPFWLPCHSTHDYTQLEERLDPANNQCAGAAIHRANIGRAEVMPDQLLHLPADPETVFATQAEFLAHHTGLGVRAAEALLAAVPPEAHMQREYQAALQRAREGKARITEVGSEG